MGGRSSGEKGWETGLALKGASRTVQIPAMAECHLWCGATAMAVATSWGRNCPAPPLGVVLCSQTLAHALLSGFYQVLGQPEGLQAILAADRVGFVVQDGVDKRLQLHL